MTIKLNLTTQEAVDEITIADYGKDESKIIYIRRPSQKTLNKKREIVNNYPPLKKLRISRKNEIAKSRVFLKRIFKEALMLEEDEFIQAEINQETIEKVVWLIKDRCLSVTRIGDKINASNNAVKKIIMNAIRHGLIVEKDLT